MCGPLPPRIVACLTALGVKLGATRVDIITVAVLIECGGDAATTSSFSSVRYQMRLSVLGCLQCASLVMCGTTALAAQNLPPADPGTLVRSMNDFRGGPGNAMHAVVLEDWTTVSVTHAFDGRARTHPTIPSAGVASVPRRSAAKSVILGGLIGAAAGAVFGSIAPRSCCVPFGWSRAQAVALWAAGGAGAGAGIGLVVSSGGGNKAPSPGGGMERSARTLVGVRVPFGHLSLAPR